MIMMTDRFGFTKSGTLKVSTDKNTYFIHYLIGFDFPAAIVHLEERNVPFYDDYTKLIVVDHSKFLKVKSKKVTGLVDYIKRNYLIHAEESQPLKQMVKELDRIMSEHLSDVIDREMEV